MARYWVAPFLLWLAAPGGAAAATYVVQPDGTGDFPTIQDALSAAVNGDTIELADGTFTGAGNRNLTFAGKSLVVRSQSGTPSTCTVDCESAGRGFTLVSVPASARIEGITITGGVGDGAAIYCEGSFLTIENCFLTDNGVLDRGAGVHCRSNAHPVIRGCTITGNDATSGGGIYCYSAGADVFDTVIRDNEAHSVGGGGVWMNVSASVTLTRCTIQSNTAAQHGGGVWCGGSVITPSSLTVTDCDISGNSAGLGGGMFVNTSLLFLTNTVVAGNHATATDGGGLYIASTSPTISRVTITANHAAGSGGAAYLYSAGPTFNRCILWADCADTQHDEVSMDGTGSSVTFQCSDASPAGVGGAGTASFDPDCFDADPLFCWAESCLLAPIATGDYALDATSPAAPLQSPCGLVGALDVGCTLTSAGPGAVGSELPSRAAPTPATGPTRILFSAPAGPLRVTLFDARGRVVRRWTDWHAGGSAGSVTWDGRDGRGRLLPAGVYFYRLESVGGSTSSGRVVRLVR